jgi:hypothetical protein
MKPQIKCKSWCCSNYQDQGEFVGEFCKPCYDKITTGMGKHGTAWFYQLGDQQQKIVDKLNKIQGIIDE